MKIPTIDRSGMVGCLGWCNKNFFSLDRFSIRFCKKCTERKDWEIKKSCVKSGRLTMEYDNADS